MSEDVQALLTRLELQRDLIDVALSTIRAQQGCIERQRAQLARPLVCGYCMESVPADAAAAHVPTCTKRPEVALIAERDAAVAAYDELVRCSQDRLPAPPTVDATQPPTGVSVS